MDGVITNKFIFQNPKIDNIRDIVIDHIKNHKYRFIQFHIKCKWELCFSDNSTKTPISDTTIFSDTNLNIITNKLFRWFYSSINCAKKQCLELISIHEMKIVFISYFCNITFKHYIQLPKPRIEMILNKKLCENPELIGVLTQIHNTRSHLLSLFFRFYPLPENDIE